MVSNNHGSKRKKETALKRGKRQRTSMGASPVTTGDDESNSTGEPPKDSNRISVGVSVDADLLGPCEPGTDVVLEGIVWAETNRGVLVVNVTWKGRTYVGTLLDSSGGNFNICRSIAPVFNNTPAEMGDKEPFPLKCADNTVENKSARTEVDGAQDYTARGDANHRHLSAPACFQQLSPNVTKCKSPAVQQESSNAIQRLEFMTSNRINALQTQSAQTKPTEHLSCAQIEQSPINALSSLIEDTSKSFEINNRSQNRYVGQKSASWPTHEHNGTEWVSRRPHMIHGSEPPFFQILDQKSRQSTADRITSAPSRFVSSELSENVTVPFARNASRNRSPNSH